jgi:hypothetical protein
VTPQPLAPEPAFHEHWFRGGVRQRSAALWRGVEAQHIIATMKLVDSAAEQVVLEELLETSKPPVPPAAEALHYLIFTPFRYRPTHPSRFRPAHTPGLWYGAEELETACAEVAYWKWRFLMDSAALADSALHTQHTFFQAQVSGRCINLTTRPWNAAAARWQHGSDYTACHQLAAAAREHGVEWIRYASTRREHGVCGAVLAPASLSLKLGFAQQSWACKTTRSAVFLQHAGMTCSFDTQAWA